MNRLSSFFHHALRLFDNAVFSSPRVTLGLIALVSVFFALQIPGVRMYSNFADLLPQGHAYIKLHNQIRDNFGGANNIIVGVEVEEGDIFTNERLAYIHRLTQAIDSLPGVNHNLVSSLTHRNTRRVWLSETGGINSESHYDPLNQDLGADDLARIRSEVATNPRVFGLLVSADFKAALIKATFNEGQLDYELIFQQVQQLRQEEAVEGISIHVSGQPMMVGWIYTYVGQILQIFLFTAAILVALLVLYFRRLYGILLPLLGILLSSVWGLGIISLLGFNLDPLTLVVPFLISARAMSHGVQLVQRYYQELNIVEQARVAARNTFDSLFRPGILGVTSDAIGLLLIALSSVPINVKLAYYASLWAFGVIFTVLVFIPLALTILPHPGQGRRRSTTSGVRFQGMVNSIWNPSGSRAVLGITAVLLLGGAYLSSWVQIGEAEPGTPLLYPEHDYNLSSKAINTLFPGSEELYVIARTEEKGGIKRPEVLRALESLQVHMLNDPDLGGAKGVPDLVKQVNRILHNDDPRWMQIPDESSYVGGLMFSYMASSPVPGALKEFIDTDEQEANLVFYYKDHKGETIRRAIHMVKEWVAQHGSSVEGLSIHLAGGSIGVMAAINEASYSTNMLIIPLVLGLIFVFVTLFYWSWHAGWLMLLAMSFSTLLTYAYMGLSGVGINVNTVPIIAVGIGVGIDYSIYIMDRVREEMSRASPVVPAVRKAIRTTGVAIAFTAASLISGVIMWVFLSDLRFQSDAALLLCVMLTLNAVAAIFIVPAWIMLFRPAFITRVRFDEDGILVRTEQDDPGGRG